MTYLITGLIILDEPPRSKPRDIYTLKENKALFEVLIFTFVEIEGARRPK